MLHQGLQPSKAASYESIQEAAVRTMLLDTLNKPDGAFRLLFQVDFLVIKIFSHHPDFQEHAKKYAASVIMSSTSGGAAKHHHDLRCLIYLLYSNVRKNNPHPVFRSCVVAEFTRGSFIKMFLSPDSGSCSRKRLWRKTRSSRTSRSLRCRFLPSSRLLPWEVEDAKSSVAQRGTGVVLGTDGSGSKECENWTGSGMLWKVYD